MRLAWLGFVVILFHNVEEALTAPAWLAANAPELQARFGIGRLPWEDAERFYLGLTVVTIAVLLWIALAGRASDRTFGVYSLAFLFAFMFCNALVPHIAGAVLLRRYVPGVLTAALLVVPFTLVWSIEALRKRRVTVAGFIISVAAAAVAYGSIAATLIGLRGAVPA